MKKFQVPELYTSEEREVLEVMQEYDDFVVSIGEAINPILFAKLIGIFMKVVAAVMKFILSPISLGLIVKSAMAKVGHISATHFGKAGGKLAYMVSTISKHINYKALDKIVLNEENVVRLFQGLKRAISNQVNESSLTNYVTSNMTVSGAFGQDDVDMFKRNGFDCILGDNLMDEEMVQVALDLAEKCKVKVFDWNPFSIYHNLILPSHNFVTRASEHLGTIGRTMLKTIDDMGDQINVEDVTVAGVMKMYELVESIYVTEQIYRMRMNPNLFERFREKDKGTAISRNKLVPQPDGFATGFKDKIKDITLKDFYMEPKQGQLLMNVVFLGRLVTIDDSPLFDEYFERVDDDDPDPVSFVNKEDISSVNDIKNSELTSIIYNLDGTLSRKWEQYKIYYEREKRNTDTLFRFFEQELNHRNLKPEDAEGLNLNVKFFCDYFKALITEDMNGVRYFKDIMTRNSVELFKYYKECFDFINVALFNNMVAYSVHSKANGLDDNMRKELNREYIKL